MIRVEGYKAFRGVMRITPKPTEFEPFDLFGDWLYKPEYDCWYSHGRSFHNDICTVVEDSTGGGNG